MAPRPSRQRARRRWLTDKVRRGVAARAIYEGRKKDARRWSLANGVGLRGLSLTLPVDLEKIIRSRMAKARGRKARVLDLGCLDGNILLDLHGIFGERLEYWGTSLRHNPAWREATEESNGAIRFKVAMAERLAKKFPENYFDVIYSNLAITHSTELGIALAQARKILRRGGLLVASFGDRKRKVVRNAPGFKVVKEIDRLPMFTNTFILEKT